MIDMLPSILRQVFQEFSLHFLEPSSGHLDFRYSSILMTRLLHFFDPELANEMKDIDHSLYLIKWFMTLFAHTLPLQVLIDLLWTDIFCERVDYLFLIALGIIMHLRERLMLQKKIVLQSKESVIGQELNEDYLQEGFGLHSLAIIQILSGSLSSVLCNESEILTLLKEAKHMKSFIPNSFICTDLAYKQVNATGLQPLDELRKNEYFSKRWWELENLDYNSEICLPLISVDDCVELKKNKILIDIRPFTR